MDLGWRILEADLERQAWNGGHTVADLTADPGWRTQWRSKNACLFIVLYGDLPSIKKQSCDCCVCGQACWMGHCPMGYRRRVDMATDIGITGKCHVL